MRLISPDACKYLGTKHARLVIPFQKIPNTSHVGEYSATIHLDFRE